MPLRQIVTGIVGLTICAFSIWGLILFMSADRLNNWLTLEQINERVRSDLVRGTPLSEIDKYFTSNHVEHSYVERTNEVYAMIRFIWGGEFLVQKDAQIRIELDQDRKLKDIKVVPVFTGP
jgi:hypothetical protein